MVSYPETGLDSEALAPFRAAIQRLLRAHEPYPAMVIDGHYTVVDANAAASTRARGAPQLRGRPRLKGRT